MKSNNKIEAIIYLILVVILCASLVGGISNIAKRGEELFGGGNDKLNTTTTEKPTTTKPVETTKPTETTKPVETTAPCSHKLADYTIMEPLPLTNRYEPKHKEVEICSLCSETFTIAVYDCFNARGNGICLCLRDVTYICSEKGEHTYSGNYCLYCDETKPGVEVEQPEEEPDEDCEHYNCSTEPYYICLTDDYHTPSYRCIDCGTYVYSPNVRQEHDFLDGCCLQCGVFCKHENEYCSDTVEATCASEGEKIYSCSKCNEVLDRVTIPKLEHVEGEPVVIEEPTCQTTGTSETSCVNCGEVLNSVTIPVCSHDFVEDYGGTTGNHTVVEVCSICGVGGSVNVGGISCVDNDKDGLCDFGGCEMN